MKGGCGEIEGVCDNRSGELEMLVVRGPVSYTKSADPPSDEKSRAGDRAILLPRPERRRPKRVVSIASSRCARSHLLLNQR